ncbi:protein FAM43B [Ambystoma mexicanum]|uniref:protein FAM43B n=1 Tax=Ambystoma mexicanum TaxID=8296 RepID=UPI0037E98F5F
MLPWKRSKFVLVEEKPKLKDKSPEVTYMSLLSFVQSCPGLLPECPLERLGNFFKTKRQKVELNKEDPTYSVWYLGNAVTLQAKGEGCTQEPVGKIWAKSDFGCSSTRMRLTLGPHGIRMTPSDKGSARPGHAYQLHRITYCATDARHPKVFAWIYRHQTKNKAVVLRCHAVMVSKSEKARAMARHLGDTTLAAFSDFKRLKRQSDARHTQQQLLGDAVIPRQPLRKVLKGKNCYHPAAGRGIPRLTSILEEEEEDGKEATIRQSTQGAASLIGSSAQVRPRHVLQPEVQVRHVLHTSVHRSNSRSHLRWEGIGHMKAARATH